MTKHHILNPWLMLAENVMSRTTSHADKQILPSGAPVTNPSNLNTFAEIDLLCFAGLTLTEGELRSPDVWIASVQRSRFSHALTEANLPSPTPGVPAYLRGRLKRVLSQRCIAPLHSARTVREVRACFDTFAARTRCVTTSRLSRFLRGTGEPGRSLHRADL